MSQIEISRWLELPGDPWPPNHYVLLGLEVGEVDVARIEERVYERMAILRCYQLTHPDQVTDGMNLVAQAFSCLTDAAAKRTYDLALLQPAGAGAARANPVPQVIAPPDEPEVIPLDDEAMPARPATAEGRLRFDPFSWLFGPRGGLQSFPVPAETRSSVQQQTDKVGGAPALGKATMTSPAINPGLLVNGAETASPQAPPTQAEPLDRVMESARSSAPAKRGIGTKRALYHRIAHTRQLLWAWEQTGKYLNSPVRKLTRPAEATDLTRQLMRVRMLLPGFPPLLGEAGQPGYLVVALARQQLIIPTFRGLLASQREALARDWQTGYVLLVSHRDFLRQELRGLRKKPLIGRVARALRALITDQPATVVLLVALVVLNLAIWVTLRK